MVISVIIKICLKCGFPLTETAFFYILLLSVNENETKRKEDNMDKFFIKVDSEVFWDLYMFFVREDLDDICDESEIEVFEYSDILDWMVFVGEKKVLEAIKEQYFQVDYQGVDQSDWWGAEIKPLSEEEYKFMLDKKINNY